MSNEEVTPEELLRDILWSRTRALRAQRWVRPSMFGMYAAVAAVVDDHDRRHPNAPADGLERIASITAHAHRLHQEQLEHPDRFSAAAGLNARRFGTPDPQLLALAGRVLRWLPLIATHPNDRDET